MFHKSKLRKVGGSVMVAIPPALLDELDLKSDAQVALSVKGGRLLVEPAKRRYTLAELLAQSAPKARKPRRDAEWLDGGPTGKELI